MTRLQPGLLNVGYAPRTILGFIEPQHFGNGTRCVRDCESIIQIKQKDLTTENTEDTEKITALIQCIKNSVFSVYSVVSLLN